MHRWRYFLQLSRADKKNTKIITSEKTNMSFNNTPTDIQYITNLFLQAAQNGVTDLCILLKDYVAERVEMANIVDEKLGANPLHWAAYNGHEDIVKLLVGQWPKLINTQTHNGSTPLLNAVVKGHKSITIFLLQNGADPRLGAGGYKDAFSCQDKNAATAYMAEYKELLNKLFCDALFGDSPDLEKAKQLLEKGADVDALMRKSDNDKITYTALFHACTQKNLSIVDFLIQNNAALNVIGGKNGFTPLHAAVYFGYPETVQRLKEAGASLTMTDALGRTPLALAKSGCVPAIVDLLEVKVKDNALNQPIVASDKQATTENLTLEERLQRLSTPIPIRLPNSLFLHKPKAAPQPIKPQITLAELKLAMAEIEQSVDSIEKNGNFCIKWVAQKCHESNIPNSVKDLHLDRSIESYRETITNLRATLESVNDLTEVEDLDELSALFAILGNISTNFSLQSRGKIIPSREYGKEYLMLTDSLGKIENRTKYIAEQIDELNMSRNTDTRTKQMACL